MTSHGKEETISITMTEPGTGPGISFSSMMEFLQSLPGGKEALLDHAAKLKSTDDEEYEGGRCEFILLFHCVCILAHQYFV